VKPLPAPILDLTAMKKIKRMAVQGDPTEAALILAAQKAGLTQTEWRERHPRLDVIPFESEHQYLATLHGSEADGANVIFMKGSVEQLIERCASVLQADSLETELDKEASHRTANEMAAQGLRVLAFARRLVPPEQRRLAHTEVAGGG
jgi:Ca2+-transporting ATPase